MFFYSCPASSASAADLVAEKRMHDLEDAPDAAEGVEARRRECGTSVQAHQDALRREGDHLSAAQIVAPGKRKQS